jgi:hypothetical protein
MDFDTYLLGVDNQNYNEYLAQTLRDGLSDNGWTVPNLTTAEIGSIAAMLTPSGLPLLPIGTIWFNTTLAKLQVLTARAADSPFAPTIQTITSV